MDGFTVSKSLIYGADSRIRTADLLITKPVTADAASHWTGKGDSSPTCCGFGEFPALGARFDADFRAAFATDIKTPVTSAVAP